MKPCSAFGISATTRLIIASAPATNGSWLSPTRGSLKTHMPRCLYGAMTLMAFMVILTGQKDNPGSVRGETSWGLQARSSVRLFCPGDRGVGGDGEGRKLARPIRFSCPTGQGMICDDQHNWKFSVLPSNHATAFPRPSPVCASFGHSRFARGRGVSGKPKRCCSFCSPASPGDRFARTVGSFFCNRLMVPDDAPLWLAMGWMHRRPSPPHSGSLP